MCKKQRSESKRENEHYTLLRTPSWHKWIPKANRINRIVSNLFELEIRVNVSIYLLGCVYQGLYLKTEEGTLQSSSSRRNLSIVEVKEHVASVKSFEVLRVLCLAFSPLLEAQFKSRIVLSSFGYGRNLPVQQGLLGSDSSAWRIVLTNANRFQLKLHSFVDIINR